MLWPPIPFSYDTVITDLGVPAPSPPSRAQLARHRRPGARRAGPLIYGFRISVLFGLMLTVFSSLIGVAAGAVQGFFGGWVDLLFQRLIEIWVGLPRLYMLIILASIVAAELLVAARPPAAVLLDGLVDVVRAEFLRAPQLRLCPRRPRARRRQPRSCAATCCPTRWSRPLTFLPFILTGSVTG